MPEMPDVISGETVESSWGNEIRDRTLQRYVDAAERDGDNPLPVPGDLAYLASTGEVQVFGTSWVSLFRADGADTLTPGHLRITRDNSGMIVMERSTVANNVMGRFQFQILGGGGMQLWGGSVDDVTIPAVSLMQWPAGAWFAPTLISNWVNFGAGEQPARYRRNIDNTVTVQAAIKDGDQVANRRMFDLPAGFRPLQNLHIACASGDTTPADIYGQVKLLTDGGVVYRAGGNVYFVMNFTFAVD